MITDEDLLLYYYRDGLEAAERARIGAALSEQPELAQRLHRLVARLDAAASEPEVPVPAHTQQRWQAALERMADSKTAPRSAPTRHPFFANPRWLVAGVAAASVAVIALVLTSQQGKEPPNRTASDATPSATDVVAGTDANTAYERGLKWHLASTERQLATLESATPEERALLVETIVSQNRMYALAAERAGAPQLARVLRAFAPVLESLAVDDGDASASSIARLNFELRVIQARLNAATHNSSSAQPVAL